MYYCPASTQPLEQLRLHLRLFLHTLQDKLFTEFTLSDGEILRCAQKDRLSILAPSKILRSRPRISSDQDWQSSEDCQSENTKLFPNDS